MIMVDMKTKRLKKTKPRALAVWCLPKSIEQAIKRSADKRGLSLSAYMRQHLIREFGDEGR